MTRYRRVLPVLSVAAALAAILTPGPASAGTSPYASPGGRLLATVTPAAHQPAPPASITAATVSAPVCTPTPAGSREHRAGGVKLCVRTDPMAYRESSTVSPMDATTCAITTQGEMRYHRFGSCRKTAMTGILLDDKNKPIGTSTLNVTHNVTLRATSSTFDDTITITLAAVTGAIGKVAISLDTTCLSACRATNPLPWAGARTLSVGQSASGTVTFAENLAKGAQDTTRTVYHAFVTVPGALPAQPNAVWDGTLDIRCDNAVGSAAGCVYPSARGEFQLSIGQYRAAAVLYYWAQTYLPDSWGYQKPLHRLADDAVATANRARTCDSTFVRMPADVPDDSCDEFPFAKTVEGGTPGPQCADVIPALVNGKWRLYEADANKPVKMTEHCVRGHVPLTDNEGAGGELGRFTQAARILDREAYDLYVVD